MSRFIKYASNLLDGVDNIAKGSLTDQDLAAAAAERRRRRKQANLRQQQEGGDQYQSEGLSDDSAFYVPSPGIGEDGRVSMQHTLAARASRLRGESYNDHADDDFVDCGEAVDDANADVFVGESRSRKYPASVQPSGALSSDVGAYGDSIVGKERPQEQRQLLGSMVSSPRVSGGGAHAHDRPGNPAEASEGIASIRDNLAPPPNSGEVERQGDVTGLGAAAAAAVATLAVSSSQNHGFAESSPSKMSSGGASDKAGGASQRAAVSAALLPAPGKEDGSGWSDDQRPPPRSLATVPVSPSFAAPASTQFAAQQQTAAVTKPHAKESASGLSGGSGDGIEGSIKKSPRFEQDGEDSASAAPAAVTPTKTSGGDDSINSVGAAGKGMPPSGATRASTAEGSYGKSASIGRASSAAAGGGNQERQSQGFGKLLGRGGKQSFAGGGGQVEALKAEADAMKAEIAELSLELEDAEERLRGQEEELYSAAENLKRQKAAAQEREIATAREMDEFRALQSEEKKVFLVNLEGMERSLKDKDRELAEARSALSALETFALEREDAATRLMREKEELMEDLSRARSGQDRSAEEVREALARAEAEAEEAGARHRAWMRQAQARQTELEATAAQLAEALAEAKRNVPGSAEGSGSGVQGSEARKARASSARELRAYQEELDSCQASLELEEERTRSLQQEVNALRHDLDAARATEAVVERQRQEHANMAADAFAKASRLEQQLEQEKAKAKRLGALLPAGPESQIQSLSSKLLDKQARLEESVCERATLSAKLREVTARATRAEQELREARGETLESGGDGGRRRRRQDHRGLLGVGGGRSSLTGAWSRLPPIAKHKKIASAVDVVDRMTLQAVVFIRNSPAIRAGFLAYLILLHLWAFAILGFHSHVHETPAATLQGTPAVALQEAPKLGGNDTG